MAVQQVSRDPVSGSRASDRNNRNTFAGSRDQSVTSKLIGIKGTAYLHKRMRDACEADGLTSAELISSLLDLRERDIRRRVTGNPLSV